MAGATETSEPGRPVRPGRSEWFGIALAVVIVLAVALWGIRRAPLWLDEGITYYAGHLPLGRLVHLVRHVDLVHGTYYAFIHVVFAIFDGRLLSLRVPSAVALAATAGVVSALAVRLTGRVSTGVVAAVLLAASPFVSYNAQNGRSYALVCLVVAAATLQLVRIIGTANATPVATVRAWVLYGLLITLAVYLHELAALAVLAHGVTVALVRATRTVARRWLVTTAISALVALPLVLLSAGQAGQLPPRTGGVALRLLRLWQTYTGRDLFPAVAVAVCAVAAVVPLRRAGWRARSDTAGLGVVTVPLVLVPSLIMNALAAARPRFYSTQYLFFVMPAVALLAAAGAVRIALWLLAAVPARPRPALAAVAAGLLALGILWVQLPALRALRSPAGRATDLTAAARYVGARKQDGDGVVFLPSTYRSTRLAYQRDFAGTVDVALARSPERALNLHGDYRSPAGITTHMLARRHIWLVGRIAGPDRPEYQAATDLQLRVLHRCYRTSVRDHWRGVGVILWLRVDKPGC